MAGASALLTVSGVDRPGVTARLFSALAGAADGAPPVEVVDVEQVVVHGQLVLGVVVASLPVEGRPAEGEAALLARLGRLAADVAAAAGVQVRVDIDEARVPAYTIAADHPAIRAARSALAAVYPGQEVLLACIGGTLPATALFERALGAKTLFFSFSTSDENLHAPNEFLRITRLREGMRAWEVLWRQLAAEGTLR